MLYRLFIFILFWSILEINILAKEVNFPIEQRLIAVNEGAIPDGKTLNTDLIQSLIDRLHKQGGGELIFTQGKYLIGSIFLKSNVKLYLEKNAILLGSTNPKDYNSTLSIPKGVLRKDDSKLALIMAVDAKNISIEGKGIIDGQGRNLALNIDSLHHIGECIDSQYNYRRMRPNETMRPKLFYVHNSQNIKINGLSLRNSACWGVTFDSCSNVILSNLHVFNRAYWNNDGIDITDCKRVVIESCNVNSADDGICLKSYNSSSCNDSIIIKKCIIRSSASAIKFGSASHGGFKNIKIDGIHIFDTYRSAIAIESVDGGQIENIRIRNIIAKNTGNAIFVRLGNRSGGSVGCIRGVRIENMEVDIPFGRPDINYDMRGPDVPFFHNPIPASITGIPGYQVEDVSIKNIKISYPGRASRGMAYIPLSRLGQVPEKVEEYPEYTMFGELPAWGFYVRHVKNIDFENITLIVRNEDYRPAIIFDDTKKITIKKMRMSPRNANKTLVLKNVIKYIVDRQYKHIRLN